MRRRVLIIASWFPTKAQPLNGIFVLEQAQLLAREHDVAVLAPYVSGWHDLPQIWGEQLSTEERIGGVLVRRERTFAPVPYFYPLTYARYLDVTRRGFRQLLSSWGRPDIIHAHVVLPGGWAAVRLGEEYGIPVILTEHSNPFSMHLGGNYQRDCVRSTLRRAARVLAVSPALADQIRMFDQSAALEICGNVVRTEFFTPVVDAPRDEGPVRLLTVALLSPYKGISYLLQAARLLRERGALEFELVIGGDGAERGALERQAQELGLEGCCRFVGMLDRTKTRDWMRWCDLFVLPSLSETFGIVLGEAMACGKPVVATRCGGPEYLVTPEDGELVERANPEALADAIERSANSRGRYNGARIRQHTVERFGEQALLQNLSALYDQLLGS